MKVWTLVVKMADNQGRTVDQLWVCDTRETAWKILQEWVYEQNAGMDGDDGVWN